MYNIILLIHVIIAVLLVTLVLIQQGKGASAGASFGGGGGASGTVFGSHGSGGFLLKVTAGLAAGFFATSITLGYIASSAYKQSQQINIFSGPATTQISKPAPAKKAPVAPVLKSNKK